MTASPPPSLTSASLPPPSPETVVDLPPPPRLPSSAGPSAPVATPERKRRPPWFWVALIAGLVALVLAIMLWRALSAPRVTQEQVDKAIKTAVQKAQEDAARAPADGVVAFQTIAPSLVTIVTSGAVTSTTPSPSTPPRSGGLGTGVVVSQDGNILTALHVVESGANIQVTFADGTKSTAKVAQKDDKNDIAVLAPATLPKVVVPAVLGGGVNIGDEVFAVGNPFGLIGSLSAGAVSGLDRSVTIAGSKSLKGLIQFDAAVNPGNSGGPLLNRSGQVVGIVTSLANPAKQAFFIGIGFAVPINTAAAAAGGGQK